MRLIKDCPDCGKKLRFPIDRGTIKVKCPCGFSFTVDPDNTEIYKSAKFDFDKKAKKKPGRFFTNPREKIIRGILQYRYNLQNIRLLTGKSRRDTILITAAIIIALILIVCLIGRASSSRQII
jgi:hypothetical protein